MVGVVLRLCDLLMRFLLLQKSSKRRFTMISLSPKQVVKDHLGFSDETLERLPQVKSYILPGDPDLSKTNFTETEV
jgi:hypothetical protein